MTEQEKDAVLYQLVDRLDETEKLARKYMMFCVHDTKDKFTLNANRVMIDGIKKSLKRAAT